MHANEFDSQTQNILFTELNLKIHKGDISSKINFLVDFIEF